MNNTFATTGLQTFAINSIQTFAKNPRLNGLPWDLTLGQATLILTDPEGGWQAIPAQIVNGGAQATVRISFPVGTWTRQWDMTDASGRRKVTLAKAFDVSL